VQMRAHGGGADAERVGDLLVVKSAGEQ
jgi:hypothetical protein